MARKRLMRLRWRLMSMASNAMRTAAETKRFDVRIAATARAEAYTRAAEAVLRVLE